MPGDDSFRRRQSPVTHFFSPTVKIVYNILMPGRSSVTGLSCRLVEKIGEWGVEVGEKCVG